MYFISFLLRTGGLTLFYISLPVYLGLCVSAILSFINFIFIFKGYFPLTVTFGTPIFILERLRRQWIKRRLPQADKIREAKTLNWKQAMLYWTMVEQFYSYFPKLIIPIKYALLYILLLPFGSIVGLAAFGFSLILLAIFLIVLFIKLIPIVGQVYKNNQLPKVICYFLGHLHSGDDSVHHRMLWIWRVAAVVPQIEGEEGQGAYCKSSIQNASSRKADESKCRQMISDDNIICCIVIC